SDEEKLDEVRRTILRTPKRSHRFAELTVEQGIEKIRSAFVDHEEVETLCNLQLFHVPITPDDDRPEFRSHSEVLGLPLRTSALSAAIGEAVSYAVTALHPALKADS